MPSRAPEAETPNTESAVSTTSEASVPEVEPTPIVARKVLTKGEIFAADDLKIDWVDIEEWNGGLYVKGLTGKERDAFERIMVEQKGKSRVLNVVNFRAKLIARTAVDSDDRATCKLIFNDSDVEALARKSASAIQKVYDKASKLSGFSAEEIETLTEELGNDLSDGSGSA